MDYRKTKEYKEMDAMKAIDIIELEENPSENEMFSAWQYLVDAGMVNQLQGFYGRTAQDLIESEVIQPRGYYKDDTL